MRILCIITNLGSGGAEKLIEETVPLYNQINGVKVDVLLLTDTNNVFQESLELKGVKVDVISLRSIYNPLNIIMLRAYIQNGNYDIVHSHLFPTQYWVGITKLLLKSKKIKFVTTEHSNNNRRRDKFYFRMIDKYIYSMYDCIISITDKVQLNLINWIDPNAKQLSRFIVIQNGVNIEKFKEAIPYLKSEICIKFTEQTRLISMVGRFSHEKDQPTLIKALKELSGDVHLLLVGEGVLRQQCEELAIEIGINNRVHFLGFRNDIARILKTSDTVVLSSNWEGLSLASIEGMASGKPFVASRVEGLEDIVGEYGILFECGDSEELSEILRKLLADNDFYNEISNRCVKRAEQFHVNVMVKSLLAIYNELVG